MSRRGPRCPDVRLSQHYIGPKMKFIQFSKFCKKSFPTWQKKSPASESRGFATWFLQITTKIYTKIFRNIFVKPENSLSYSPMKQILRKSAVWYLGTEVAVQILFRSLVYFRNKAFSTLAHINGLFKWTLSLGAHFMSATI